LTHFVHFGEGRPFLYLSTSMNPMRLLNHTIQLRSTLRAASLLGAAVAVAATPLLGGGLASVKKPQPNRMPANLSGHASAAIQDKVPVMVELKEDAAAIPYATAYKAAMAAANAETAKAIAGAKTTQQADSIRRQADTQKILISPAATQQIKATIQRLDQAQQQMLPSLTGGNIGGQVLYRVQKAYNGIAIMVTPDKIAAIQALPNVKAVHPMAPKVPLAFSDIDFLGARSFWNPSPPNTHPNHLGIHGEAINVADIDSGLDYIHVNFGGPGSSGYAQVPDHTQPSNPFFPSRKVPGGYDFAGDDYDATGTPAQQVPHPDPDPFDSGLAGGHGTGTASLIGGYGVNSNGTVFTGSYGSSTPIGSMSISPGFAPLCNIYALKVFGTGSTNLVTAAIDWAMDPNGDGDMSDHMDVINMSLGGPDGFAEDSDNISASNAAAIGIIVASAAGNDGDTYYIVSGPSVATGTLSVAASFNDQSGYFANASVTGNSTNLSGKKFGAVFASSSPHTSVTNDVVYAIPHNGSTAFTNAAQVAGHIALIDRGVATFTVKAQNAMAAGAVGIIVADNRPEDPITQSTDNANPPLNIPDVMITQADGNTIKTAAQFDSTTGAATVPTNVTISPEMQLMVTHPTNPPGSNAGPGSPDTIPSYSSRGPRSGDNGLKPDLTAPAEVVSVAAYASGNGPSTFNGTSSSTPHVAGSMALLRQLHPSWSVAELNAVIANTATHDLFTTEPGPSPSPTPDVQLGVGRIGAGRIDLDKASNALVVAYDADDNSTGLSFGHVAVPVDSGATITKNILVTNKGTTDATYDLSYHDVNAVGDANFTFAGPITIPAGQSINVPVTFTATGNTINHPMDPSISPFDPHGFGFDREWLTEKTGYLVFTPPSSSSAKAVRSVHKASARKARASGKRRVTATGVTPSGSPAASTAPSLRVALYAAPSAAASMHATSNGFVPDANSGTFNVNLTGADIFTGGNVGGGGDVVSLLKAFELQFAHPAVGTPNAPATPNVLKYAGVTSDYNEQSSHPSDGSDFTVITFGIDRFGDVTVPAIYDAADVRIFIDADQDGTDDFEIITDSLGDAELAPAQGNIDNVYYPILLDLKHGGGGLEPPLPTNLVDPQLLDMNTFNNSAVILPIFAGDIGLAGAGATAFNYRVEIHDRTGALSSSTPELTYDMAAPGVNVQHGNNILTDQNNVPLTTEPVLYQDTAGNGIPADYVGQNVRNNASLGVLLLHMHNGPGNRSDAVVLRAPILTNFSPTHGAPGTRVTITGNNFNNGVTVTFNNKPASSVSVISATTLVATVPNGATTGRIRVSNSVGTATSRTNFSVP
jgi:subtilisin family serine protease